MSKYSDLMQMGSYKNDVVNINRILNGDMQVAQRGTVFSIKNDDEFTADRWVSSTADDNELEVRVEDIYSPNEGAMVDATDPFGDDSQVACYQLNGDATDLNGNYDGDATDVTYENGKFGDCGVFTGGNNNTQILTGYDIDETSVFTVSVWVKLDDDATEFKDWCGIFDGNSNQGRLLTYIVADEHNRHYKKIGFTTGEDNHISEILSQEINLYEWHHCVFFYGGINEKMSLIVDNGNEVASTVGSDNKISEITIGRRTDGQSQGWKGKIDQFRIFNRELTKDEVKKLYVEDYNYIYKKHLRTNLITKGDTYTVTPYEYRFEGQHIADILIAKESTAVSFEFAASVNQNFTVRLYYPDGTLYSEDTISYNGNKEFTKHSVLFDFNDIDLTKVNLDENLGLVLTIGENDELNEGDYLKITNVQLEKGNVATEFEVLPYESQLDRCLRYYRYLLSDARGYSGGFIISQHPFPSITRISPALSRGSILDASRNVHTSTFSGVSKYGFRHEITPVNENTDTYELQLEVFADAELPGRGE